MFASRQVRQLTAIAAATLSLLFAAGTVGAGATTTRRASGPSWPERLVAKADLAVGPVVVPGRPYAYGIVLAHPTGTAGYLDRFNLATGAVTRGAAVYVSDTAQLVTVGNQLGFVNGPACTTGCYPGLDTLRTFSFVDLHTLALTRPPDIVPSNSVFGATNSVPAAYCIPESCATPGGIKSEPGQVWIGNGPDVELINLSPIEKPALHSRPLRGPIRVPGGHVVAIAVSPNCHYLYVGLQASSGAVSLVELNTVTGAIMAAKLRLPAVGDVRLQAVPGGVWISYRGGMDGAAYFYSAAFLQPINPPTSNKLPVGAPQAGQSVGMGVVPTAVPPAIFLSAESGLTCVTLGSGRALAGEAYPPSASALLQPFAARHLTLYTSGTTANGQFGIIAVTTPAGCWNYGPVLVGRLSAGGQARWRHR